MIEHAKSGRAKCKKCKQAIAKDELRFGEEAPNAFGDSGDKSYVWYHLACAAKQRPQLLKADLDASTETIPDREQLVKQIDEGLAKQKPTEFPYAERAPTSRSRCIACDTTIEKGTFRVAVERDVDTGSFVTTGPGYLHAACAPRHTNDPELLTHLTRNSRLGVEDVAQLEQALKA